MGCESSDQSQSLPGHRSESKVVGGQKRAIAEVEETSNSCHKRTKMRDLESVFPSEAQAVKGGSSNSRELDLNLNVSSVNFATTNVNPKTRSFHLDLNNTDDISNSASDPFFPYNKTHQNSNSMRIWKGLKQNNYMSPYHNVVPASLPKPRGKKKLNNNEVMKKKIEQAKKEQVDRFARVAAPSGLLNGLNPGIINHVRNSKQVHSIIEALVRSEKRGNRQMNDYYGLFTNMGFQESEVLLGRDRDYSFGRTFTPSQNEDDKLKIRLSSSVAVASENTSCLSNDESANLGSVNSLSYKAANVASQWLEVLNQDIKGRVAALRRSKRRVRAVIATELPLLLSREFSHNIPHFDQAIVDAHSFRWRSIFEQMENTLAEEENQLESWLNQVKEMQLHCEKGVYKNSLYHVPEQEGPPVGNESSLKGGDELEKDLAMRAAAASIYSTCNFLLAMENC
ncbi:hypothetical protein STAS_28219 [Striga asiatica]|uniref:Uncharacterized protein n=1 Tax=Striga asiatica TaxID=4170 RepID=A0A5A7R0K0_STRAF|nr:hypothetical protein STAS_28219 [Striga asiatica]